MRTQDTHRAAHEGRALHEAFEESLNECGTCRIGTLEYLPARALASVDPVAYWIAAGEFFDALTRDGAEVDAEAEAEFFRLSQWNARFFGGYDTNTGAHA